MGGRGGGSPGAKGAGQSDAASAPAAAAPSIQDQITEAFRQRSGVTQGEVMRLSDMRDALPPMSDEQWRHVMDRASRRQDVKIFTIANLISLSQRDKDASVKLGGEVKHAMQVVDDRGFPIPRK